MSFSPKHAGMKDSEMGVRSGKQPEMGMGPGPTAKNMTPMMKSRSVSTGVTYTQFNVPIKATAPGGDVLLKG